MNSRLTMLLSFIGVLVLAAYILDGCASARPPTAYATVSGVRVELRDEHVYRVRCDTCGVWHIEDITEDALPEKLRSKR